MMYQYKGYEIEKLTRNTYRIRRLGAAAWIDMWGHYPRTLKAAKAMIDAI